MTQNRVTQLLMIARQKIPPNKAQTLTARCLTTPFIKLSRRIIILRAKRVTVDGAAKQHELIQGASDPTVGISQESASRSGPLIEKAKSAVPQRHGAFAWLSPGAISRPANQRATDSSS